MTTLSVLVQRRLVEAEDICSFELVCADGALLPAFTAGAHIDVHMGASLIRQYSLCNDPSEQHRYCIAVLREQQSRGGSLAMHEMIQEGQILTIGSPRNHFPLVPAKHNLLIAGGIGITPILAMVKKLHGEGSTFEMHYCGRSALRMAFIHELTKSSFKDAVHVHVDDGKGYDQFDANAVLSAPQPETHLYVCGPGGFMNHVLETAKAFGWPDSQLHREYFAASPADTSDDGSFEVKLAKSGQCIEVPAKKTVLEVLLEQGLDIPYSCESGVCGTCLTGVIEGAPDHRDSFLTDAERQVGDQFLPCCSRSKSPVLVLDI